MRFIALTFFLMLGACSHGARRIDCEKHLTAINPPNPVVKTEHP